MNNTPENPYKPPAEQDSLEAPKPSKRRRNVLLEIVQAFTTIVGIMLGWGIIGYGAVQENVFATILGALVIGVSCLIGMGFRLRVF